VIKVTLFKTGDDFVKKFTVEGHAGYAPSGSDIICSAVSALTYTAIGSLQELTGYEISYEVRENDGYMKCEIHNIKHEKGNDEITAEVIMNMFDIGCRQISDGYGKKYVKVVDSSFKE